MNKDEEELARITDLYEFEKDTLNRKLEDYRGF